MARVAVVLDFDGTASPQDVGGSLLAHFARDESWRAIDADYANGLVGSRLAYRLLQDVLRGGPEEWVAFALAAAGLDPGLGELAALARRERWNLEILSDGLDLYIHALLDRGGMTLPVRCNRLRRVDGRTRIFTPHMNPLCGRCGTCKAERVAALARAGWEVAYVGDGHSDLCAAPRAHRLFAKDALAAHCREREVAHEDFEDLGDVARALQRSPTRSGR